MTPQLHPSAHAHGKVILLGEHAVVHGEPALAAGLPGGVTLEASPLPDRAGPIELELSDWSLQLRLEGGSDHPVARACLAVLAHCDGPVTGWRIVGRSALPAGAGLGSSAALTVAVARLVLGPEADIDELVRASLVGERVFHGDPSGVDSEVSARGGVLWYARGQAPEPVRAALPLPLVVIPSGVPRSTATQVAKVAARLRRWPEVTRPALGALGAVARAGREAVTRGDLPGLGELMGVAHALLGAVDVSSPTLDRLCGLAMERGALGAKLTGAGFGGCVVALAPAGEADALCDALARPGRGAPGAPPAPPPFAVQIETP